MDRLTATDASFLYGETPEWHLHVTSLLPLDAATMPQPYRFETFQSALAAKLRNVSRFRQRIAQVPLGLDRPVWVDAGPFDRDAHIRLKRLPAPSGQRELFDLAGELAATKLSHERPLWEFWVVEDHRRRLQALVVKNHHVLFDGVDGLASLEGLFELAAEELAVDVDLTADPTAESPPGAVELVARSAVRAVTRQPWETVKVARQLVRQAVPFGRTLISGRNPLPGLSAPRNPFGGRITAERSVAGVQLPMPVIKAIRAKADVKVNDVLLAVIGGALRRYLVAHDLPADDALVANIAVSTRTAEDEQGGGNKFCMIYATLGSDEADPVARLTAVHTATAEAKEMLEEINASRDTTLSAIGPPLLVDALGRVYQAAGLENRVQLMGNVGVSNVAGPPVQLYIGGAAIASMFVFGPLIMNSNLNFTAISNADGLHVGIATSPSVVPDLDELSDQLLPALNELAESLGVPT